MRNKNVKYLVLCAILIALSIGLNQIKLLHLPFGGSITLLSMLAATLAGYFCGPKWGLISGLALGLLNLAFGGYVIHPIQLILDYILAFTALGLSGFFTETKNGLYIGYAVSVVARFFCSFLSGFIFFGEYAPEGMNPALYSFAYNGISIGAEGIITLIILAIPVVHDTIYRLKKQFND
ncbi:MAG: energy-coupled thiamine transporter ThiT [Firmicutes bacterium]|nr:energy-coupled thiamine transporter ThiT [Bacillota bacterium]MCR4710023.1 energy-coupled thiamine transporter ThiT [Clostridiales bacterium]